MLNSMFEKKENDKGLVGFNDALVILSGIIGHMGLEQSQFNHLMKCALTLQGDVDYKKMLKVYSDRSMQMA